MFSPLAKVYLLLVVIKKSYIVSYDISSSAFGEYSAFRQYIEFGNIAEKTIHERTKPARHHSACSSLTRA
jgi:hypothetical protein